MSRHLIDSVPHGWDELGTDLLDGAPAALRRRLIGDDTYPSRPIDMTNVIVVGPQPEEHEPVTQDGIGDLQWAYVLHPHGIEVIALQAHDRGPVVAWDTDPRSRITAHPAAWHPGTRAPITAPRTAPRPPTATTASAPRTTARR
ncbi:hypothetical protein ACN2WE_30880 [Streptomyces sp. cg28]|uniref:hypothetical protein n=1 Tax=Streptomyces sp. cg28 TaxID=3403457 RepID=UPI003B21C66E